MNKKWEMLGLINGPEMIWRIESYTRITITAATKHVHHAIIAYSSAEWSHSYAAIVVAMAMGNLSAQAESMHDARQATSTMNACVEWMEENPHQRQNYEDEQTNSPPLNTVRFHAIYYANDICMYNNNISVILCLGGRPIVLKAAQHQQQQKSECDCVRHVFFCVSFGSRVLQLLTFISSKLVPICVRIRPRILFVSSITARVFGAAERSPAIDVFRAIFHS